MISASELVNLLPSTFKLLSILDDIKSLFLIVSDRLSKDIKKANINCINLWESLVINVLMLLVNFVISF
jgi:hypothetical protein